MATRRGDRERFLDRFKEMVNYCSRISTSDTMDDDTSENVRGRLQLLRRDIERASGGLIAEFIPLLDDMEKEVSARFAACRSEKDHYRSERVAVDGNGHFKFSISKEQLEYGFTAPLMSNGLGISESTVRRRLRWEIVIHGGIDGNSRMVTFLKASNNNRSITVLNEFIKATTKYGITSRVRIDKGIQNNDVFIFMEDLKGNGRGSAIRGKSSHNQRIERLWVDSDMHNRCSDEVQFKKTNKRSCQKCLKSLRISELFTPEDYGVGDSDDGDVTINSKNEDIQTIHQRTHEYHLLSRLDAAINPLEKTLAVSNMGLYYLGKH
ncbi:unnamed protein product [Mytilus edulis]|uniref:Integrase core domain-containing protein n=1 Tax=Mytilus edulis TaxID=6550 RepID=A0A8S3SFK1_MYTED|nr:unnamed protein product [Mytilus edulis]